MVKKLILKLKWMPCDVANKFILRIRNNTFGSNMATYGLMFIRGKGKISIGDNVIITSCVETNPIGGDSRTILYAKDGDIVIGNATGISNSTIVAVDKVVIGDHVMIGGGCKIYDNDFHSILYSERSQSPDPGIKHSAVYIEDGAFIGGHSIILKGVTIGKRSVIGAGSVVTTDVPADEVWAGNPARFVKKISNN